MKKQPKRFDMTKKPRKTPGILMPLIRVLSVPDVKKHGGVLRDLRPAGLKAPYILLSNHNAFMDFKVMTSAIWPQKANYIVAIDGFLGREKLLRDIGCICKRKFTSDILLVRQIKRSLDMGNVCVIFPEARYSLCGTTAVLPESLGMLCKMMKVPVVMLSCHGHHINSPFWDSSHDRGVNPIEASIGVLFTPEELAEKSADEINARLVGAFQYDDFAWQKENGVRVTYPKRAEGLHNVLYQGPECGAENRMGSENDRLFCRACHASWRMTELGEL
ncbi:MAG: 1-acyl-sn-glycerol-3-phosphate acyltransferase, partial [Clostridia bacterium]|nr:1-acyl-sn-glycerol-3-phosphate acyltransferase [Clostridia bacterium]